MSTLRAFIPPCEHYCTLTSLYIALFGIGDLKATGTLLGCTGPNIKAIRISIPLHITGHFHKEGWASSEFTE